MKKQILIILLALISTTSFAQVPFYVPTSGLIAWYPFSGDATDATGDGLSGTVYGATLTTDRFGATDSAYYFDTTSYIELPNNSLFDNGSYSISFWLRDSIITSGTSGSDVNPAIMSRVDVGGPSYSDSVAENWAIYERNGRIKYGSAGDTSYGSGAHATTVSSITNTWHHIVYTVSNGASDDTIKCYKDGVRVFDSSYITGISYGIATTRIGRSNNTYWRGFRGCVDDIAFYSRAITPCEVLQLYTASLDTAVGFITGDTVLCISKHDTLTDSAGTPGGTWSASNAFASVSSLTGIVTGVSTGTDTIKYTISNACGTSSTKFVVHIYSSPSSSITSATTTVCSNSSTNLLTSPSSGGVWSITDTTKASISTGGTLIGKTLGVDTVYYKVTTGCATATAVRVFTVFPKAKAGVIIGDSVICIGAGTVTLHDSGSVGTGTWASSSSVATVNSSGADTIGIVTPGTSAGTVTIKYRDITGCSTDTASKTFTVTTIPSSFTVYGANYVCTGSTLALSPVVSGGTWSTYNGDATVSSTGVVTGVSSGTDTVYYTVSNSCGPRKINHLVSVDATPGPGVITGPSAKVCIGDSLLLADTATSASWRWKSSNSHATVDAAGEVTGVTAGVDTIRHYATIHYTAADSCSSFASYVVNIATIPDSGTITSPSIICVGTIETLVDSGTAGGIWSATNGNVSITDSTLTGLASGTDTVTYTVTSCGGTAVDSQIITIHVSPDPGGITGLTSVCPGASITLEDTLSGGSWSVTNSNASVSGGTVDGVTAGLDTVKYTVNTTACGTSANTKVIIINPLPNAGTITGPTSLCTEQTATLYDTTAGGSGTWSASNSDATITTAGLVDAFSGGIDTFSYTYTNVCGTAVSDPYPVTINATANAGILTGLKSVCVHSTITLTDSAGATGGSWTVTNANASVTAGATVGTGIVTGVTAGTDIVKYTIITATCGTQIAHDTITVNPLPYPGVITGVDSLCPGGSVTLSNTTAAGAGTWSVTNSNATISASGVVHGVFAGLDTVVFSYTNICGTADTTFPIKINASPDAGTISGATAVCPTHSVLLAETVTGGTWGVTNSHASIAAGGGLSGVSAGIDTITYSVSSASCGSAEATYTVTVNPLPIAGSISGLTAVCPGSSITLTESATGGVWSASNSDVTVVGGIVTGVTAGTVVIEYSVTNLCPTATATYTVTVNPLPDSGVISGASAGVCESGSYLAYNYTHLSETVSGGLWRVTNTTHATITSSTGVVHGLIPGIDTVWYIYTNSCGSDSTYAPITINALPDTGTISGLSSLCVGSETTLSETATGGSWSSSNTLSATISSSGVVTAIANGVDVTNASVISYSVTNVCGTYGSHKTITIVPTPDAQTISGAPFACLGSSTVIGALDYLYDPAIGGTYSATNSNASVDAFTGVVTPNTTGVDTIIYTYTNSCGTDTAHFVMNVYPQPDAGTITGGASSVCAGGTLVLSDAAPGGVWSAANGDATVSGGAVVGVTGGSDLIAYTVTNSCNVAIATYPITINAAADPGSISGTTSICQYHVYTFTNPTATGGTWASVNANATVVETPSGSATVTGVAPGTDIIKYMATNACGTSVDSFAITINPAPDAGYITGNKIVCFGDSTTLTDLTGNGVWSTTNLSLTIGTSASPHSITVIGVDTGMDVIKYTVSNSCGSVIATDTINVNKAPVPGSISGDGYVCVGGVILLSDSVSGGHWSVLNGSALISSGIVAGVTPGLDTVTYSILTTCGYAADTFVIMIQPASYCEGVTSVGTITNGGAFKVYPNPSNGAITIIIPQPYNTATVNITDVLGKVVATKTIINNQSQSSIDLSNLSAGNYILKVNTGDNIYQQKITLMKQ